MVTASRNTAPIAQVAVPLPLPTALSYLVPLSLADLAAVGCRVKVQVGRRKLTGLVMARTAERPAGVALRSLDAVVDMSPVVTTAQLELATFTAEYYMAPIGEVVRLLVPNHLEAWGTRRVRLTNAGALARPRDAFETFLQERLLAVGSLATAELHQQWAEFTASAPLLVGAEGSESDDVLELDLLDRLRALASAGRISLSASRRAGAGSARYVTAIELPPGDHEQQLAACGRSPKARAVVSHLARVGRPATQEEVLVAVGCTAGVIQRLVKLGILRRFTQVERIATDRQLLAGTAPQPFELRPDQADALDAIEAALDRGRWQSFVLAGMTGSGKTEVYLRAAERVLDEGKSVLILVPEIGLVPALGRELRRRFGDRTAILHSALGKAERQSEWERLRAGEASVVLGPRSAVFAPLERLGLVVVDEEHDGAYKQEKTPRYNGRDLALVRARNENAVALLVSATPSMETRQNVLRKRYKRLELTERAGVGRLPDGVLVDLRKDPDRPKRPGEVAFSGVLREGVANAIRAGEQVILLRNRRGYAPVLLCRACGEEHRCEDCGLPRTFHRRQAVLVCHYCGARSRAPERCGTCQARALEPIGAGTERVEENFKELFPEARVAVLDRDTAHRRGGAAAVLEGFARGESDVLIGTQMVAKGHHFPRVSLTAVLSADSYLGFPDFRAVEKTYSLLTQVAGRAGRGERPGTVIIQTLNPEHYAIQAALHQDDAGFAEHELRLRRLFHYPPFSRMVQLVLQDRQRERGEARLRELARRIEAHPLSATARVLGPAPAPLEKLKGRWRFQLLIRGPSIRDLQTLLRAAVSDPPPELTIDVDPWDLL